MADIQIHVYTMSWEDDEAIAGDLSGRSLFAVIGVNTKEQMMKMKRIRVPLPHLQSRFRPWISMDYGKSEMNSSNSSRADGTDSVV